VQIKFSGVIYGLPQGDLVLYIANSIENLLLINHGQNPYNQHILFIILCKLHDRHVSQVSDLRPLGPLVLRCNPKHTFFWFRVEMVSLV